MTLVILTPRAKKLPNQRLFFWVMPRSGDSCFVAFQHCPKNFFQCSTGTCDIYSSSIFFCPSKYRSPLLCRGKPRIPALECLFFFMPLPDVWRKKWPWDLYLGMTTTVHGRNSVWIWNPTRSPYVACCKDRPFTRLFYGMTTSSVTRAVPVECVNLLVHSKSSFT